MTITLIELPPDEAEFLAKRVAYDAHEEGGLEVYDAPDALLEVYDRITWHAAMIRGLRDGRPFPVDAAVRLARKARDDAREAAEYERACRQRAEAGDHGYIEPFESAEAAVHNFDAEVAEWEEQARLAQAVLNRAEGVTA